MTVLSILKSFRCESHGSERRMILRRGAEFVGSFHLSRLRRTEKWVLFRAGQFLAAHYRMQWLLDAAPIRHANLELIALLAAWLRYFQAK